jgi:prephenate dehydrogenase
MTTIGIIGAGLIGTSIGLAASVAGYRVLLYDRDPDHLNAAVALGAGQPWEDPRLPDETGENVAHPAAGDNVDLVVIAVPPSSAASRIVAALKRWPQSVVTDVSSVKGPIVAAVNPLISPEARSRFVPGHPMAGRENSGPTAARAELFRGRPWLLCPTPDTSEASCAEVSELVSATGAITAIVALEVHDRMVAVTSHVPQVVSSLMAARLADCSTDVLSIAGQGLRDVTRLGASNPALWRDILTANAAEVVPVLQNLGADLQAVVADLSSEGVTASNSAEFGAEVEHLLRNGNEGAARLPAKHGGEAPVYSEVLVEVPDSPGALGALFLAAGDAGVNLEDVRIEHTVGRLTAIAHLYVLPEVAPSLREVLAQSTWRLLG